MMGFNCAEYFGFQRFPNNMYAVKMMGVGQDRKKQSKQEQLAEYMNKYLKQGHSKKLTEFDPAKEEIVSNLKHCKRLR